MAGCISVCGREICSRGAAARPAAEGLHKLLYRLNRRRCSTLITEPRLHIIASSVGLWSDLDFRMNDRFLFDSAGKNRGLDFNFDFLAP